MTSALIQQQVLAQAKAGDLGGIAGLLKHRFAPEGITTRVRWLGRDRLLVELEAAQAPQATVCLPVIERGFQQLAIPHLVRVDVAAYQQGREPVVWRQQVSLTPTAVAIDLAAWLDAGSSLQSSIITVPQPLQPTLPQHVEPMCVEPGCVEPKPMQQYLSFTLGMANPGLLAIEAIQEIFYLPWQQILPVPAMGAAVLGLHYWRGEMLWLVDLNDLLGRGGLDTTALSSVSLLVLRWCNCRLGLMVQTVGEILPYNPEQLQTPRGLFNADLEPFITGYHRESSSIVLNPAAILNAAQQQSVHDGMCPL
ncbi:MAG: chemotaxis protein CheW [Cyanobacteria bacterium P01_G01_bin.54]